MKAAGLHQQAEPVDPFGPVWTLSFIPTETDRPHVVDLFWFWRPAPP